jgi:hypothetical protein
MPIYKTLINHVWLESGIISLLLISSLGLTMQINR